MWDVGYDTHRTAEACTFRADEQALCSRESEKEWDDVLHSRKETTEIDRTNNAVRFWGLTHKSFADEPPQRLSLQRECIAELTDVKSQLGLLELV